jgi:hypothetical protein
MAEVQRTEVITSVQRGQWWSVEETLQPGVVGLVAAGAVFRRARCSTGGGGWPRAAGQRTESTTR